MEVRLLVSWQTLSRDPAIPTGQQGWLKRSCLTVIIDINQLQVRGNGFLFRKLVCPHHPWDCGKCVSCGPAEHSQQEPVSPGVKEKPSKMTGLGIKCKTWLDTEELSWGLIFFLFF